MLVHLLDIAVTINIAYAVFLLLDFENSAILEGPLDDVCVWRSTLDEVGLLNGRPPLSERLKFDVVPDLTERGFDDGRFHDGGGCWDC